MRAKTAIYSLFPALLLIDYLTTYIVVFRLGGAELNPYLDVLLKTFGASGLVLNYVIAVIVYTCLMFLLRRLEMWCTLKIMSRNTNRVAEILSNNFTTALALTASIGEIITIANNVSVMLALMAGT